MKTGKHQLTDTIIIICAVIAILQTAYAAPVISIEPSAINVAQGDTFIVNISVDPDGTEIYGIQYKLFYNNNLLKALNQKSGHFLNSDGAQTMEFVNIINNSIGKIEYAETRKGIDSGVTASGTLTEIEFEVRCSGSGELNLQDIKLGDPLAQEIIDININNATVDIPQSSPYTPFMIHGNISCEDGSDCNDPVVNITNLNLNKKWTAITLESSNYYRITLECCADVIAGEILQFNVEDQDQSELKVVNHTVTSAEIEAGGFELDIQLEQTSIPIGDETISIGSMTVDVNDTFMIPIFIANATGLVSMTLDVMYGPNAVIILNITANNSIPSSIINYTLDTGKAAIELMNSEKITVTSTTVLIDITFKASENTSFTELELQNIELVDGTGSHDPCTIINGSITVCIKGDFNNNNRVDIGDVAKVAFMVAEKVPADTRADFNKNDRVDVGDAAKISFYLAQKVSEL